MSEKFESWGVVEVMGHQRFAGWISEQSIGGASFVRVDVPEVPAVAHRGYTQDAIPAYTKLFGGASIYAITPCTEEVARRAVANFCSRPLSHVDLVRRDENLVALPHTMEQDDGDGDFENPAF